MSSIDTGRGRKQGVALNLTPFIDFLSCILAFLMITAVWTEVSALNLEQSVNENPAPVVTDRPLPLTIRIHDRGMDVFRNAENLLQIPLKDGHQDREALTHVLSQDRSVYPTENMVIINVQDGIPYGDAMSVLDTTNLYGYSSPLMAGG